MPVYAYDRHSTNKQRNSRDVQVGLIEPFAAANGLDLSHTFQWDGQTHDAWFHDEESGSVKLLARKEGGIMCRVLQPGDIVIATRLDRLFRDCFDMEFYIDKWVRKGGVLFYLVEQGGITLDVRTSEGRAMLRMLAAIAELERENTSERTAKTLQHKKRQGQRVTNHPGPGFKWQKVGDKMLRVPNWEELAVMRQMLEWHQATPPSSVNDIAMHLNKHRVTRKHLVKGKIVERPWARTAIAKALQIQMAIEGHQDLVNKIVTDDPGMGPAIEKARDGE